MGGGFSYKTIKIITFKKNIKKVCILLTFTNIYLGSGLIRLKQIDSLSVIISAWQWLPDCNPEGDPRHIEKSIENIETKQICS